MSDDEKKKKIPRYVAQYDRRETVRFPMEALGLPPFDPKEIADITFDVVEYTLPEESAK